MLPCPESEFPERVTHTYISEPRTQTSTNMSEIQPPPATGRLPACSLLPKHASGNTEWKQIENCVIPRISGVNGRGFYSAHVKYPESEPQSFIYEADLLQTGYTPGEFIGIRTGLYFIIHEHSLVEVVWDDTHYD
jgi:hypothetical protein